MTIQSAQKPSAFAHRSCPKQISNQRHEQHDGESAGEKSHARALRRIPQQGLHKQRQQQSAGEQGKAQHEHHQIGRGEVSVFEQMQIYDGIFMPPLPDGHEHKRRYADQCQSDDEIRLEPVIALAFIEHNLQSAEAERDQAQADIVDFQFR